MKIVNPTMNKLNKNESVKPDRAFYPLTNTFFVVRKLLKDISGHTGRHVPSLP